MFYEDVKQVQSMNYYQSTVAVNKDKEDLQWAIHFKSLSETWLGASCGTHSAGDNFSRNVRRQKICIGTTRLIFN